MLPIILLAHARIIFCRNSLHSNDLSHFSLPRLLPTASVRDRMQPDDSGSLSRTTRYSRRRYFQHAHFIPIVGVGKRGEY